MKSPKSSEEEHYAFNATTTTPTKLRLQRCVHGVYQGDTSDLLQGFNLNRTEQMSLSK